jgi:ATP-dependent protease Clp ATPase subunit
VGCVGCEPIAGDEMQQNIIKIIAGNIRMLTPLGCRKNEFNRIQYSKLIAISTLYKNSLKTKIIN